MYFAEFSCGCIGLRDFDTEQTIIVRDCSRSPDDVQFYFAASDDHAETRTSELLRKEQAEAWMKKIRLLILDGKRMREMRRIININENNEPTR